MVEDIKKEVKKFHDQEKARFLMRFFKTAKGEYAEGDIFYGLTVPQSRKIAAKHKILSIKEIISLLKSPVHEERLIALLLLIERFKNHSEERKEIYEKYLENTKYINNWDLVDLSADKIVGEYLRDKDKSVLQKLANSENLWDKRISIIATFQFIKEDKSETETFRIADILLHDQHDLIQKAVGWMLREVGKRISEEKEEEFLKSRYKTMPRTALRYAIERFSIEKRKHYLTR